MTDTAVQDGKIRTSGVRLSAALLSGAVASGAHMALLGAASAAGINTAHGSAHLNAIGMTSFAIAHMAFFEVLSVLYGCLFSGSL